MSHNERLRGDRPPPTVRHARPDDIDGIIELQRIGLGEGTLARSAEVWRWKHVDNPFGPSAVLVAESGGTLVGLRAFMRWSFVTDGGSVLRAVRAVDTVTHPDWQGQGLFTRLTKQLCNELANDGVDLVFNTPNDKSRPGYLKMGWRDLGRMMVWARPMRPGPFRRHGSNAPAARDALVAVDIGPRLERGLHTPVDGPFLRWRYGAVPGLDYRSVIDHETVVVGRRRKRTLGGYTLDEAMICEVVVGPGLAGIARASQAIRRVARGLDAHYAVAVAPFGSRRATALAGAGFIPVPRAGPHFTVRRLQATSIAHGLFVMSSWGLGLGDLELF